MVLRKVVEDISALCFANKAATVPMTKKARIEYRNRHTVEVDEKNVHFFTESRTM